MTYAASVKRRHYGNTHYGNIWQYRQYNGGDQQWAKKSFPDIDDLKARLTASASSLGIVSEERASEIKLANTERWICSMLSVSGSSLEPASVHKMISGECALEATIEESLLTDALLKLRTEFDMLCAMRTEPDEKIIRLFHSIITGGRDDDYRKGTPHIKEMALTPPHSSEISARMRQIEIDIAAASWHDSIDQATALHDMIMSVWPFNDYNDATAYAAMSYSLLLAGYPLPTIKLTQYEHRRLAAEYVHAGTSNGITTMLLISLLNEYKQSSVISSEPPGGSK